MKQKLIKLIATTCIVLGALCLTQADTKAEYVTDSVNGVSYDDEETISAGYAYSYANGAGGYSYISLSKDGDRVANIISSSKNLLVKKTRESISVRTETERDYDTDQLTTTTTTQYGGTYISFFAKKPGSYKVTFDVIDAAGHIKCTKNIKVTTYASNDKPVIKSIKYCGKELYEYYPFATRKKGKLSVTPAKGYSIVSIEVGKMNKNGDWDYKKTKNNKTIALATSTKYTQGNDYYTSSVNELFPSTLIRVTLKNKKTKDVTQANYSLCTINKK